MAYCCRRSSVEGRIWRSKWSLWAKQSLSHSCWRNGISTLYSHQYGLADEGVTKEIKRQTFSSTASIHVGTSSHSDITRLSDTLADRSADSLCSDCKFPFIPRRIWPSEDYHLSCSPCCKPLSHAYVYHCLLPERSCDTGL